jgi:hypothetical protein
VSPWLVEQEVGTEVRRLYRLQVVALVTFVLWAAGGALIWLSAIDLRLRAVLVLVWLVVANRAAAWLWDLATRRAVRRWRTGFRGRVRRFGLEHAGRDGGGAPDLIRVVCTYARYTRVTADGSLTDEVDPNASWGYWIPGLGYLGWGLESAAEARDAAIRRMAGQLTARRDDQTQPPVATDIREQEEIWFAVQFWPADSADA